MRYNGSEFHARSGVHLRTQSDPISRGDDRNLREMSGARRNRVGGGDWLRVIVAACVEEEGGGETEIGIDQCIIGVEARNYRDKERELGLGINVSAKGQGKEEEGSVSTRAEAQGLDRGRKEGS